MLKFPTKVMNTEMKKKRAEAIRRVFDEKLKEMPVMRAYIETGNVFFLSDERIRQIIAGRR